jgi:hypothetical protein
MSMDFGLKRLPSRIDPFETYVAQAALAREVEKAQVVIVSLELDMQELRDELWRGAVVNSWLVAIIAVLLAGIFVAVVVFAFQPTGVPR